MDLVKLYKPETLFQSKAQASGVWLDGPYCKQLKQKISEYLGVKNVLLVNKLIYRFSNPRRFDIVEFKHNEKIYIKRIIGLPGETIKYQNHNLYVGDTLVEDSFASITNDFSLSNLGYNKIPDNYYLVLGDNRTNSEDSRMIGLVSKDEIVGRTIVRIWPINKFKFLK